MKTNKAVLQRVAKYRERRGFKIVDSNSKFYKFIKIMYILAFAWFAAMLTLLIIPIWVWPEEMARGFDMLHKCVVTGVYAGSIAACVTMLCRQHVAAALLNAVFPVAALIELKYLMHNNRTYGIDDTTYDFFGDELLADYVWRHAAPAVLMMVFCLVLCIIYFREKYLFRRDYNKVLDALYITYKDRLGSGTEEEWQNLLAELDDQVIENELDRQYTKAYKEAKNKKEKAEKVKAEKVRKTDIDE